MKKASGVKIAWPTQKTLSVPIPPCREPFINAHLLRLTPCADGLDRYWISSWNSVEGSVGVLIDEYGKERLYPSGTAEMPGFYSAVQTAPETLWLCGNLSYVVRLDLKSGKMEKFATSAPAALVFAGMAYDPPTGKLFAVAYPAPKTIAFSFDTRTCRPARIFELPTIDHYMRSSYAHADGAHSIELQCPGMSMVRWHPASDKIEVHQVCKELDLRDHGALLYRLIAGDDGRLYMPRLGWYNPAHGIVERQWVHKSDNITWFARTTECAYGLAAAGGKLYRWQLKTNEVAFVADCSPYGLDYMNAALTTSGALVGVSLNGRFTRINLADGELEVSKMLPTDRVQVADCAVRIDKERVLGTPFITQRFWEANLRTQKGFDCGSAAPGSGEIMRVWNVGGKIYMAAYNGGELMEYDPQRHPHFPENPRVVAKPASGLRPVGAATDRRRIFYCCSHKYGTLGSVVISYDTKTGLAKYRDNPLPDLQIRELFYDKATNSLICGTTIHADCQSAPPIATRPLIARLDADTLEVRQQCDAPQGADEVVISGPLGRGRWLGVAWGAFGPEGYGPRAGLSLTPLPLPRRRRSRSNTWRKGGMADCTTPAA